MCLCRRSKEGSERSLAAVMSAMYYAGPKHFDVQDRLCLGVMAIIYVARDVGNRISVNRGSLNLPLMNQ